MKVGFEIGRGSFDVLNANAIECDRIVGVKFWQKNVLVAVKFTVVQKFLNAIGIHNKSLSGAVSFVNFIIAHPFRFCNGFSAIYELFHLFSSVFIVIN